MCQLRRQDGYIPDNLSRMQRRGQVIDFIKVHKCSSFVPLKGASEGVCQNVLGCRPIKDALRKEPLITRNLGHVICPEASVNLAYVIYSEFDEEALTSNYGECLES